MKPAVFDANIFIDMLHAELLPDFLKLRYVKCAPPDVIDEVQEAEKHLLFEAITSGQVNVPVIEDLTPIVELKKRHTPLSFQACACLHLALDLGAMLVTGEKPLRRIAGSIYKLEVHGSLFIFDQLVKDNLLSHRIAHERLSRLLATGTYLPHGECQKRLKAWRRKFEESDTAM